MRASSRPKARATSLSAVVAGNQRTTLPATPAAIQKPVRREARLGRWMALGLALSALAVGSVAQAKLEPWKHHGAPGLKHTPEGSAVRWRKQELTVYLDSSLDDMGGKTKEAVQRAFGTWLENDPRLPALRFDSTQHIAFQAKPDGKNSVVVAPITVPGHERDLAVTLTYSDDETGNIVETDIIINSRYDFRVLDSAADARMGKTESEADDEKAGDDSAKWASADNGRSACVASSTQSACSSEIYDIQNVMTHEVGHFFGLGEDLEDATATMYYCTNRCETHKRALTVGDSSAVTGLYATNDSNVTQGANGCGGARMAPKGSASRAAWAVLALAGLLARRRRSK